MPARQPDDISRAAYRLVRGLAVATAFVNTTVLWEVIPIRGAARVKVRFKATNTGTLDLFFLGPGFDQDQASATAYASLLGTIYTTGNPTQVAIVANTEAQIFSDCYGEGFAIVKFTGTATGAITYADVSQV